MDNPLSEKPGESLTEEGTHTFVGLPSRLVSGFEMDTGEKTPSCILQGTREEPF